VSAKKIILDCDPGHDDAIAILLTLSSPDVLQLLGITCVAGNVPLSLTTQNALNICELAERRDVPVYAGADRPLVRSLVTAESVHGQSGLDLPGNAHLPTAAIRLQEQHAVDFIIETLLLEHAGSVTLCATGPLTNVALAMRREPAIVERIYEIILMGGAAINPGNVTPAAEFNIYVDPHAADIVFRSGVSLTMMGLDVTHQVLVTTDRIEVIRGGGGNTARTAADLLTFYCRHDRKRYGIDGGPLHDPCVIAHLLDDGLFETRSVNVEVEVSSPLCLGQTVTDWWSVTDRPVNCNVAYAVDDETFFEQLATRLARLP